MRAFITGITGFAGSHLAEHLLACGDSVAGSSCSGHWSPQMPAEVVRSVRVLPWDLASADPGASDAIDNFWRTWQPEVIYHLAALTLIPACEPAAEVGPGVSPSPSLPQEAGLSQVPGEPRAAMSPQAHAVNLLGTRRVAELWQSAAPQASGLLASTSRVYTPAASGNSPLAETSPTIPKSGYGASKLAAEQIWLSNTRSEAQSAASPTGRAIVARAFQHTGPRQTPPMMLPEWCDQYVAAAQPVRVKNLSTWIDLSDVRDVVRAYRLLVLSAGAQHSAATEPLVFNVGSGQPRQTRDVWRMLQTVADPGGERKLTETSPGERHDPIADITRLCAATSWRAEIPLERTVAETFDSRRRAG